MFLVEIHFQMYHFLLTPQPFLLRPHQIGAMGEGLEKDDEVSEEKVEVSEENDTSESESPQETSIESEPETDVQNESEEQELENPDVVQPTV